MPSISSNVKEWFKSYVFLLRVLLNRLFQLDNTIFNMYNWMNFNFWNKFPTNHWHSFMISCLVHTTDFLLIIFSSTAGRVLPRSTNNNNEYLPTINNAIPLLEWRICFYAQTTRRENWFRGHDAPFLQNQKNTLLPTWALKKKKNTILFLFSLCGHSLQTVRLTQNVMMSHDHVHTTSTSILFIVQHTQTLYISFFPQWIIYL